ncbi:FxSxx-COOH system tetratricopeptide repeat protein [Actinomadura algeriensis]|uniref:Tetratricopeptide (TPR) repeat protein n=1 Tax=Actinomadura algeriensis TaxID=1679523 RepID=A0ABR9JSB1_9ACTN|nr:FxSxx-COOH system tetratricopeptide repeat protein [Actinomadura algeriensis]MBE1533025.1 tetratricopeptide (TPR) repeat protein [Actinomadura algeriensis]
MSATGGQPEIWGSVPMRNPHFTGRESTLDRLHRELSASTDGTFVLQALQGLGGIGKTQLATEYAHRFASDYDVVWWVPAESDLVARAALAALAEALGVGGADSAVAVRNVLDSLRLGRPYPRWLLIYDNAVGPDEIAGFLPSGGGHVIVTSRSTQWRHGARNLEIDVFDRAESRSFLAQRVAGLDGDDADEIAEALGDLPLALEQAAAFQSETGIAAETMLRELRERAREMLDAFNENPPVGYPLTLATVWATSVLRLRAQSPDAMALLDRLALFGPEPIPLDTFAEARHVLGGQFGEMLTDTLRLQRALRHLGRYSLARVETVHNTIRVHRLIQAVTRADLADGDRERARRDVHVLLSARAPVDPDDPDNWAVYQGLLGHVRESGVIECALPEVRRFCVRFARYLYVRGDYEGSRAFAESAIEHWTRAPAPGVEPDLDEHVLSMRMVLGVDLRLLGELRAAHELDEATLARMTAALGPEHEETLRLMNSYAGDLRALGRFGAAMEHDELSLELHRRVFGPDDPWTLMAGNNLAIDCRLSGRYDRALELDEETLAHRLRVYGRPTNHWVLFTRNQVARDLRELGEYERSVRRQREVVADYEQALGPEHPNLLRARKNLSVSLRKAGYFAEARELAEQVSEHYERRFSPTHLDTLAARCNLVNDLRVTGEPEEARALGAQTLERFTETLGADHPFTHGCAVNLAVVLRRLGRHAEAAELNERAWRTLSASIGAENDYTLIALANLASDRSAAGDFAAAADTGGKALAGFLAAFGADHPLTLQCAVNLAADVAAAGGDGAAAVEGDPVRRLAERLGTDHPVARAAARGERLDFDFEPPPV